MTSYVLTLRIHSSQRSVGLVRGRISVFDMPTTHASVNLRMPGAFTGHRLPRSVQKI